jgi:hypothetical protein
MIAQLIWQYCAERLISQRAPRTRQTLVGKCAEVVDPDHSSESCTKGSSPTVIVLPGFVSAASAAESLRSRVRSEVLDTNDVWTVAFAWEHGLTFLTTDKIPCIRESIQEVKWGNWLSPVTESTT